MHSHICLSCAATWKHEEPKPGTTPRELDAMHRCKCGNKATIKYNDAIASGTVAHCKAGGEPIDYIARNDPRGAMLERERLVKIAKLATLLQEAEAAHKASGHDASGWAKWYAEYLAPRIEVF